MRLSVAFVLALAALAHAGLASAAAATTSSTNWSGYAVLGASFSDVKGTWTQPAASCTGRSAFAAFWVGLGGAGPRSRGLEQIGTDSDCRGGVPTYSVWYELLPAVETPIAMSVAPNDTIAAEVSVAGDVVTLSITDVTTGATFTTQATPTILDTSSAEWIAEAPSRCRGRVASRCTPLPLASFGTVAFSSASATAAGQAAAIASPSWSVDAIRLIGNAGSAKPSELADDGASFTISAQQPSLPAPARSFGPV